MAGGRQASDSAAPLSGFSDLAGALEQALKVVKAAKAAVDEAEQKAAFARNDYTSAINGAQSARKAYDAHVNEAMSGFAQLHQ